MPFCHVEEGHPAAELVFPIWRVVKDSSEERNEKEKFYAVNHRIGNIRGLTVLSLRGMGLSKAIFIKLDNRRTKGAQVLSRSLVRLRQFSLVRNQTVNKRRTLNELDFFQANATHKMESGLLDFDKGK